MTEFDDKNYRISCSEKTLQTDNKGFFMDFVNLVKENVGQTWIQNKFGKLKDDNERIKCLYESDETKEIVLKLLSNVQEVYRKKDGTISILKRLEAEYASDNDGDLNKSLLLYSQSVLRAPKTGECNTYDSGLTLSLALWGRCKVLIGLQEYSLALSDVQQALKEHLPSVFKAEAYWKMAICYKALKEEQKSKVAFDLAEKMLENKEKIVELNKDRGQNIQYSAGIEKVIPTVDGPLHKSFPSASKKLSVKSAENLGRYIVANEEIVTGETLVVEPPLAACLLPKMFGTHCHHCFNRLRAPFGCTDCSNVAFCRPACRDAALSSYHAYECKYIDLLIGSGMSILSHTALRMVTQKDFKTSLDMYKNKSKEEVFSLCTNSEKRDPGDFLQRTLMAAFLLRCLQKCGYFGNDGSNVIPNAEELMIGELLLFNLQMLQFNAHEIFEQVTLPDCDIKRSKLNYIGVAVYPTVALFNHDCYPAVTRYFVGKNIVIKALRPLKPNEVVGENYGPVFFRKLLQDRQKTLSSRYWFHCQCEACTSNWPIINGGLENISNRIRCPNEKCPNILTVPNSDTIKAATCPKCKTKVNFEEPSKLLNWCDEQFEKGFEYMKNKEPGKAVEVLYKAIDVFHRISCPPHQMTHLAQEALQLCLASFGNTSNTLTKAN